MRIGIPPLSMIKNSPKFKRFFDHQNKLIKSKRSRLPEDVKERSFPIGDALFCDDDPDFISFIEVRKF